MITFYNKLWADAILRSRKYNPDDDIWKIRLFFIVSAIQSLNLWIVFIWLKNFDIYTIQFIYLDIFPGELLNKSTSFFVTLGSPFMVINYFAIFFRNRYMKILEKYPKITGSYILPYIVSVSIGALISGYITYAFFFLI